MAARTAPEDIRSAIIHERLRIACGLNDEVVSHLFAAALRLDGALMLTHGPLRQRLVEAIGRVDAGIRAIRDVAFGLVTDASTTVGITRRQVASSRSPPTLEQVDLDGRNSISELTAAVMAALAEHRSRADPHPPAHSRRGDVSKVAIVGCGAMGSVYAGLMQLVGHEVHGVCLWPDHVDAVNARGLLVTGASGDHTVRLASMATTTDGIGICDLVIIATKAFDVDAAATASRPLLGPATVVQTIQNGLVDRNVAQILGPDRLAIGVVGGFGASVPEPGVAHHHGMEMVRFGSFAALPRPDLEASAQVWRSSGFTVQLFDDTDQMVWKKFIMNVAFSGISCATELTIGEVMSNPSAWAVAEAGAREAVAVAQAAGITLDVGDPIEHVRTLGGKIPNARPSMLLDFTLKRRGEVDAVLGQVVVLGEKYGVATPVTRMLANIIRARESSYVSRAAARVTCDGPSATAAGRYMAVGKDTSAYPPSQPETSAADTRVAHTVLFFR